MAVSTLVATVGSASANTYATLAEADQYHEDRPAAGTSWSGATDAEKNAALLFAAKMMEALIVWTGFPTNRTTQALLWPRSGMWYRVGDSVATNVVPQEVKDAQSEFARQLIAADRTADSDIETQKIRRIKAGPVELEFDANVAAKVLPDLVAYLIPAEWISFVRGRRRATRSLARA